MDDDSEIGGSLPLDLDTLSLEIERLKKDLADLSRAVEMFVADAAEEPIEETRSLATRAWDEAERDAAIVVERIENHPVTAVGVALAVGAFAGLAMGARIR